MITLPVFFDYPHNDSTDVIGAFARPNQGKADIFIAAYDKHGTRLWQDQISTAEDDRALDLRLGDNNDVYLCGTTAGSLVRQNNGQEDIVVAR